MSDDWSELRHVDPLADGRVRIDFAFAIADLPRLRSQLARADGRVTGRVCFGRDRGVPVADVEISARAELTCQRCLAPFACPVECGGRVAMVADAAEADRAPEGLETILAPGHRISVRDLVEEELLLALPIIPLHAGPSCPAAGQARIAGRSESPGEERHRPFERLDELFKRGP
jgi:uncharacterized protein